MKTFDWIVVGGGVAGISLSEILTREGHSVALIEKLVTAINPASLIAFKAIFIGYSQSFNIVLY